MKVVEAGVGGARSPFRAEKCNKHARVWAVHQAPTMKQWWNFVAHVKKKLQTKHVFSSFAVSSIILSSVRKTGVMFSWRINLFRTILRLINIEKVSEPFIYPRYTVKKIFTKYCIFISKLLNI